MLLTDNTTWEEIGGFVTGSYRVVALKKLIELLDEHALAVEHMPTAGM